MIIAVNSRFIINDENIMSVTLCRLAQKYPGHTFLFIFDRPYLGGLNFPANVEQLIAGPETSSNLRLQYRLNFKLPALLKKHKADLLLNLDGTCSLRTKKKQCTLINDLDFINNAAIKKTWLSRFYKKHTPAFLAKAAVIITPSDHLRTSLVEKYKINEERIDIINPGIDPVFKPVDWEEKNKIKEKYTDGKSYFLFSGAVNENSNLINLLKAFTFFKKRMKSNMLMIIAGKATDTFKKELKNYRLRDEVKLMEGLTQQQLAEITAAAYTFVHPVMYSGLTPSPLQAMQCGVPVITSNIEPLVSVFGNAALYAAPGDFNDIAGQMMLVYKDEGRAKELIAAGSLLAKEFDPGYAADQLMGSILKAFNN